MFRSLPICAALIALPALAFAQADDIAVPPASCIKPMIPAADAALDNAAAEKLNAETKAFGICADAYIKARRTAVEKYQTIANAHANAANAFATDFNNYSTALAAFSAARAAKAEKDKKKK